MLKIAKNSSLTDIISEDGSNPLTTQHPIAGSAVETRVFLFNDNATKRYEGVTVKPTGPDNTWITVAPDNSGTAGSYSNSLNFNDIDNTSGHAFWVRVNTPSVADTQNKTDIKLTVEGTEFAK